MRSIAPVLLPFATLIPLTRALDTLVIHVSTINSYIGRALKAAATDARTEVEWIRLD